MVTKSQFLIVLGVVGLCGCTVGPDHHFPDIETPVFFGAASKTVVTQETAPQPEIVRWWSTLHDPQLDRLIERAVACNPDIEIALTRIQAFRTQEIVIIGNMLPQAGGSAGIAAGTGSDLTKGRVAQSIRAGDSTAGFSNLDRIAGFDAGWELDLFGRNRRLLEAAQDDGEAAIELKNAVTISVIADVARSYIEIRGLQWRLHIARKAVEAAQSNVDFAQSRAERGLTNDLDATLAKRELATVKAALPGLEASISAAESRLSLLLGAYASDILPELRSSAGLPQPPSRLKPGRPPSFSAGVQTFVRPNARLRRRPRGLARRPPICFPRLHLRQVSASRGANKRARRQRLEVRSGRRGQADIGRCSTLDAWMRS